MLPFLLLFSLPRPSPLSSKHMRYGLGAVAGLLFFCLQVIIPATYYVPFGRTDLHDERFAWRMFSSLGQTVRCDVGFQFAKNRSAVQLGKIYHNAWLQLVQTCRKEPRESLTEDLCQRFPGQDLRRLVFQKNLLKPEQREQLENGDRNICSGTV